MLIEEENQHIISDNHNESIGKNILQGLTAREQEIFTTLDSDNELISSIFLEHTSYYLHKTHLINADFNKLRPYYIFIVLDEMETLIDTPHILGLITGICTLGMLIFFVALYWMQKYLLLSPPCSNNPTFNIPR